MESRVGKLRPPDGGWGWMVCLGFSFIIFSLRSLDASFGLLFGDLLKKLEVDTTGATFITGLSDSIINFSGLFAGPLMKKIGFRRTGVLGSVLSTSGLIFTSRANSLTYLICTHSILTGLGTGLAVAAGMVAVNTYFVEKRTQAMGFAMAGSSIGMMCMPQIVHLLLTRYDFRGTVLIIGGISLHALLGSCLLQPVAWHLVPVAVPSSGKESRADEKIDEPEGNPLLESKQDGKKPIVEIEIGNTERRFAEKPIGKSWSDSEAANDRETEKSCLQKLVSFFDFDILKNPTFLNLLLGLSLFYVAEVNFKVLSPFFLTSIGMARNEVASALTLTAFADVLCRLTVPTVVMRLKLKNRQVFWVSSILIGISRSAMAAQKPGLMLSGNLILNGFLRGLTLTNMNVCVAENCEISKVPAAIGMLMVSKGLSVAILGPLIGFIRDYTGSYKVCIHSMTALIALCSVTWGAEFVVKKIHRVCQRKRKSIDGENDTA